MPTNYGWEFNQNKIDEAIGRMADAGIQFSLSADRPSLVGWWKRQQSLGKHVIAAQFDEMELTGTNRAPNNQQRGTCVGQGSSRAIEDVHNSRIVDGEIVGSHTLIAFEPMYGYERFTRWSKTQPWGTQGNCNDGLQGADAAAFYTTKGVVRRGVYDTIDLSQPAEHFAIDWNNSGVPDLLIKAAAFHKIVCHTSASWDEYADAIAAKCWGHICLPQVFMGQRVDRFGCCEPDSNGGHDTECCGICTLPTGETAFIIQQSWGDAVHYPLAVQTVDGPIKLRPGSYAVRQSVLEGIGSQVERISCDIPSGSSFR